MTSQQVLNKNYRENPILRKSFNELARETFFLDFEDWYQNGYWKDNYIPYSIIENDTVISNASANIMEFDYLGSVKKYIQIGTVMTKETYRNQGLNRILIEEIIKDYKDKVDGIFLFANDSVLNYYPKFSFKKGVEYQYSKRVQNKTESVIKKVAMNSKKDWAILEKSIRTSVSNGKFEMKQNVNLVMFYITKFMRESVYYIEKQDAYVIADIDGDELILYNIFSKKPVDIDQTIEAFGKGIQSVALEFTPFHTEGFTISELHKENTTLFLLGKDFEEFNERKVMFPELSHT